MPLKLWSRCWLLSLVYMLGAVAASASESGFADYLFGEGEFDHAILEYHRVVYSAGDRKDIADSARFKMALCYKALGKPERTAAILENLIDHGSTEIRKLSLFEQGLLFFEERRYALAAENFRTFFHNHTGDPLARDARYLLSASQAMKGDWVASEQAITNLLSDDTFAVPGRSLQTVLNDLKLQEGHDKSPALAGWLSAAVPGVGQCYAGRCVDGIAALAVNGAMGGLIAASFLNDENVLGGILAFIESWFYSGNIYGARQAARLHNDQRHTDRSQAIERELRMDIIKGDYEPAIKALFTVEF